MSEPRGSSHRSLPVEPPSSRGPEPRASLGIGPTVISAPPLGDGPLHPLEVAKLLRGEQLDHFILEDFVGIGGMGTVFRAHDTILNRTVAVKVLLREQARDSEVLRRFRNEAQSAARLDHENIARVFHMGLSRDLPYIVFEFIEGVNVRDLIMERGPLSLAETVSYILQMADALAHVSSRDVVHRDVKPSNILITPQGKAKLVDMGLARWHEPDQSQDLTASGVTLGTFDYISPEQARDPRTVDVRSDIYSLGCTFFYMLTGRPPFPDGTVFQKLLQHQGEAPPDPREFDPNLPPEPVRILHKMMAKDPAARYQTPDDLIRDLMLLAGGMGLRPNGSSGMVWVSPEALQVPFWERHLPWFAPIATLVLAVVLLEVFAWSDSFGPEGTPVTQAPRASTTSRPSGPGLPPLPPRRSPLPAATSDEPAPPTVAPESTAATVTPVNNPNRTRPEMPPATPESTSEMQPMMGPSSNSSTSPGTTTNTPANPSTTPTVPERPEPPPSSFALKRADGTTTLFATLAAACAGAANGDAIELRFNDRRFERPLILENKVLTVRAAEGYRPIIAFQHAAGDGREPATHMLTLVGGRLVLQGLQVELTVLPEVAAESWSLIRTRGCQGIEFADCVLSLRNPGNHLRASFIEVDAVAGNEAMLMADMEQNIPPPLRLQLVNCVARGEAVFVRSDEQQPIDLDWDNGLILLSRRVVFLESLGGPMTPSSARRVRMFWRHVTADLRGGLCRLGYGEAGQPPPGTNWTLEDCVLVGEADNPLIEQSEVPSLTDARLRERLEWRGTNLAYEGFETYWKVNLTRDQPVEWDATEWQQYWGPDDRTIPSNDVPWKVPPPGAERPVLRRGAEDYYLHASADPRLGASFAVLPKFAPSEPPWEPVE